MSIHANSGFSLKIKNRLAYSISPDEMARYQLSRLDLHFFAQLSALVRRFEKVICEKSSSVPNEAVHRVCDIVLFLYLARLNFGT